MNYLSVANSKLLYVLVSIAIIFVLILAAIFSKKSWNRAVERIWRYIKKETMGRTFVES